LLIVGADGQAWEGAAVGLAREWRIDLRIVRLRPDDHSLQSRLHDAYGIDTQGAVLIRPDGIIAWRSERGSADTTGAFRAAIQRVLGR
jgi:hypothetical protein